MKKRILYIPTYCYSSHPIFFNIATCGRDDFINIYLNPKDPFLAEWQRGKIDQEYILGIFHEYYDAARDYDPFLITYFKKNIIIKALTFILFVNNIKKFKKQIINILNEVRPDAILTTSDASITALVSNIWAKQNFIPFIVIQPTFIDPIKPKFHIILKRKILRFIFENLFTIPFPNKKYIFGNEHNSNYLLLWGRYFADFYNKLEIIRNIYITGNPAFDSLLSHNAVDSSGIKKSMGIKHDKPIILICSSVLQEVLKSNDALKIEKILIDVVECNPEYYFIIKIHPRDNFEKYNELFQGSKHNNYRLIKDNNLYEIFQITDVQVSFNSFTSFEAIVFGIPAILLCHYLIKSYDHFNNEIELRADTLDQLTNQLRLSLNPEFKKEFVYKRQLFLKKRIENINGNSSKHVIQCVREIMNKQSKLAR